jgi:CheY-like chemotaxis protein
VALGVLVVDDEEDVRKLIRIVLDLSDHDLFVEAEASDGTEALELLERLRPAVIVLDYMMPGMNGVDLAARILERWPAVPIVLFSAFLDQDVQAQALKTGVARVVAKGDINELPDVLREITG